MNRFVGRSVLIAALLIAAGVSVLAQGKGGSLACRGDNWYNDRLVGNCEIREQTLAPSGGTIGIDGRQNGGVSVKGWDQNQVLVRARVQTGAPTQDEALALSRQIRIETSGAKIFASGPESRRNYHWDVSYEVFVPRRTDLSLETQNGGISIADVNGKIDFSALNGGVALKRVGGDVRGSTTNGGLVIELTGDRWDGESLDVSTTNGGVMMSIPENYSANLQTGTVNGSVNVDFPVTVQGKLSKQISLNLGSGGPLVKAMTTNGGVKLRRPTANE
ncbi:MAG TPA: DUF4097 family beta strand repeat-containing protein [Pyrinomonadaceae bacterium]|nr:DUF4097 family beta strand repeat-containing protein [Pyrinomonadaceae bacterium]